MKDQKIKSKATMSNYIESNLNIFKNDTFYKMDYLLKFDLNLEEENSKNNIIMRYIEFLTYFVYFLFIFNVYQIITNWSLIESPIRILNLIFIVFGYLVLNQTKINYENLYCVRIFLEIDLLLNLILDKDLDYSIIQLKLLKSMVYNIIFNLNIYDSFPYYLIEIYTILLKLNKTGGIFCIITCFFNFELLLLAFITIFIVFIQFNLIKKQRQFWALYDSFKRSFFNLKSNYDDYPFAVFVLNRKTLHTLYTNKKAKEVHDNLVKSSVVKIKSKSEHLNFKDIIINKNFPEKFIENEIEKCLKNSSYDYIDIPVNLPNNIDFKEIDSKSFSNVYTGNLTNIDWKRIYLYPIIWKGTEAVTAIMMNDWEIKFNYFKTDYDGLIVNELITVIEDLDIVCDKANLPKTEVAAKQHMKSPEIVKDYGLRSPIINARSSLNSPCLDKRDLYNKAFLNIFSTSNNLKVKLSENDYSLLFFYKNSLNYVYDMNLTLNVYNTLRMNKVYKNLTNLHFKNFISYMIQYFYPITKSKNFIIHTDLTNELEGEVSGIYEYYRVLFFNIIMFILNNTRDTESDKHILITIKHSKFIDAKSSYYRLTFKVTDKNPILNHENINDILVLLKKKSLKKVNTDKIKILDIGLIVSYFIVNNVFNSEFTVTSSSDDTYTITAYIFISGKNMKENSKPVDKDSFISNISVIGNQKSQSEIRVFKSPRFSVEEKLYDKIVTYYKKNKKDKKDRYSEKSLTYRNSQKTLFYKKHCTDKYDKGNNDAYDSEEDKNVKLKLDENRYTQMKLQFFEKSLEEIKIKDNCRFKKMEKLRIFKAPSRRYNSGSMSSINFSGKFIRWDNSMSRIKYAIIPRILIVEDSILGRNSITTTLKHLNIQYKVDIAINGLQAIEKFKKLLNQG